MSVNKYVKQIMNESEDELNEVSIKNFVVKLKHDDGTVNIKTAASSREQAIKQVCDSEHAPESAVVEVIEAQNENECLAQADKIKIKKITDAYENSISKFVGEVKSKNDPDYSYAVLKFLKEKSIETTQKISHLIKIL